MILQASEPAVENPDPSLLCLTKNDEGCEQNSFLAMMMKMNCANVRERKHLSTPYCLPFSLFRGFGVWGKLSKGDEDSV